MIPVRGFKGERVAVLGLGRSGLAAARALARAWALVGEGRMTDALTAFDAVIDGRGLRAFGLYHKALALAAGLGCRVTTSWHALTGRAAVHAAGRIDLLPLVRELAERSGLAKRVRLWPFETGITPRPTRAVDDAGVIALDDTDELLLGMEGTATIVTSVLRDVVLVPTGALGGSADAPTVDVQVLQVRRAQPQELTRPGHGTENEAGEQHRGAADHHRERNAQREGIHLLQVAVHAAHEAGERKNVYHESLL